MITRPMQCQQGFPPLPDTILAVTDDVQEEEIAEASADLAEDLIAPILPTRLRRLRAGCYLINYTPVASALISYDGTLRVEATAVGRTASGDLYQRRTMVLPAPVGPNLPAPRVVLYPAPNPSAGIPIFSRDRYRFYLRVVQVPQGLTATRRFTLGFELFRFDTATRSWTNFSNPEKLSAVMSWTTAPPGFPAAGDYLAGDVKNTAGVVVGRLTMGWISKYLRRAVVEVDRVSNGTSPLSNGAAIDWKAVGDSMGWEIVVDSSDVNVAEPSGNSWSTAECHAAMLQRRTQSSLDKEWRYHILGVRALDDTPRGIMYDNGASDSNQVPREGCAIASDWVIPNSPEWGILGGERFGSAAAATAYFRTAVHEAGHAMGLYHNTVDNGFMNTTDTIAASGTPSNRFPDNILWNFAADDTKRLRHIPDVYVRPGGTPFGTSYAMTPISDADAEITIEDLGLEVTCHTDTVPIGAPARINLALQNIGQVPYEVPKTISLGAGCVRGYVIDPTGTRRTFSPLVLCVDDEPLEVLKPGQSIRNSLTLLRGGQGALFPIPGAYSVHVEVHWDLGGAPVSVSGESTVIVTPAVDGIHARAAEKLLATPETLLVLVLGGDHITDGLEALDIALKNPVLGPHYAYVEAKRQATRFQQREPDLGAAAAVLEGHAVMTPDEVKKAQKLCEGAKDGAGAKALSDVLSQHAMRIRPPKDFTGAEQMH
ncbi:hypothetical protein [Tahibacter amnicola]|uniref:Uncharacterized protein n=1 Tax=Tahibacter amnicola TaxID=2976241 RepID=A0ABY6BKH5_9GAMM|nr:hypothetical protein [Tahibacter amnicola]UXI70523.1 hypothetical protein N4264_13055 [Tahibacter amnicola]